MGNCFRPTSNTILRFSSFVDFVVLEDNDGAFVYAIEEEEEDDEKDEIGPKKRLKLLPSRGNLVGKLNSTALFGDDGPDRVAIIQHKNRTNSKLGRRFTRHHPQLLSDYDIKSDCFKQFCGNIPERASTKFSGPSRNGGRNLRKQGPKVDDEQFGDSQFHCIRGRTNTNRMRGVFRLSNAGPVLMDPCMPHDPCNNSYNPTHT